jgi:hypothetical protein
MSLRIPIGADQTLQVEFHEVERRLRRLERRTGTSVGSTTLQVIGGGGGSTVDLKPITDRLDALELALASMEEPITNDFGANGPAAVHGLVPTPGTFVPPTGVGDHVLKEDATWGFPLRGLIGAATPGDETTGSDTVNLLANLIATGKVVSSGLEALEIRSHGILYGEPEQARLRGLIQVTTEPDQTTLPDDKVSILADLHTQDMSAARIECMDLAVYGTASINATIDGGVP